MVKKFLLRNVAMLLCLAMLITSTAKTTYGFIIVQSDPLVNTFVPTILPDEEGSVAVDIEKEVVGDYSGSKEFSFEIKDTTEGEKHLSQGVMIKTGENGEVASYVLEYGAEHVGKTFSYAVTEVNTGIENMEYSQDTHTFTVSVSREEGTGNVKATASSETVFKFVNKYSKPSTEVTPVEIPVNVTKTFEKDFEYTTLSGFEFVLENSSHSKIGEAVVTNENGFASFVTPIKITEAGTFEYIVSETDGGINGMDYADPQTITVTADVKNNEVVITSVNVAGEEVSDFSNGINLTFINKYEKPPVPTTSVKIDVSTTIRNNVPGTPLEDFEFVLKNSDGSGMPVSEFSDENGKASFVINGITAPAQGETKVLELDIIQYKDGRYPELVYD